MATKTLSTASSVVHVTSPYKMYVLESEIDFTNTSNTLAQNDIAELIAVPGNCYVQMVRWEVKTVEGAARNFSLGDGASATGYLASTSANAIAEGCSAPVSLTEGAPNTVTGFSNGKYYPNADTIDLTAVTAGGLTTAKINVKAYIIDFN